MRDEDDNVASPNNSRVLMSDVLKDLVREDTQPGNELQAMAQNYIIVILGRRTNGTDENPMVGTLEGFMHHNGQLEVELKVTLDDAMSLVAAEAKQAMVELDFIELHDGTTITRFQGQPSYRINGVRLGAIDYLRRMCVLLLNATSGA